jgi:hypothetical protein
VTAELTSSLLLRGLAAFLPVFRGLMGAKWEQLGELDGNHAGSRKLPRQFWPGPAIPDASDVSGRRASGNGSRFSWCRVRHRPIAMLANDRRGPGQVAERAEQGTH